MIILIESGYIWNKLIKSKKAEDYPKLLITIFNHSDKKLIKQACCRQIIKYFG